MSKKLEVKGYRVLVKPDEIEKKTEAGIILVQDERVEKSKLQTGECVALGSTCWRGESFDGPWCEVGDQILFGQHSGRFIQIDDEQFLIMNDTDVLGVLKDG
jgi:chaperonin GroES